MSKNRVYTNGPWSITPPQPAAPEYTILTDYRLMGHGEFNGEIFVDAGDFRQPVLIIRCWCRSRLGAVLRVDRARRGLPPLLYVGGQIIEQVQRRATVRQIQRLLDQDRYYEMGMFGGSYLHAFPFDCASHGRQVLTAEQLRKPVAAAVHKLLTGRASTADQRPTYYLPRPE